ncbi:MAG: NADPH-dependent FMN reductase [Rhodoferax sp.]
MTKPPAILVFAGSTRLASYNRRLAKVAAQVAQELGCSATLLELADFEIPLYNADLEARGTPPDVIRLKEQLDAHPGWIICSPEYNGSYPSLLKNTLDWASSPIKGHSLWADPSKPFAGKVVGLMSASPGALGGLRALSHLAPLLLNLHCWVSPYQFALAQAAQAWDDSAMLQESALAHVRAVVSSVAWAAQRLNPPSKLSFL